MLLYIIVLVLYPILQKKIIDEPILQEIQNAKNSEEAISYRKKLRIQRLLFLLIYFIIISILIGIIQFSMTEKENALLFATIKSVGMFVYFILRFLLTDGRERQIILGNVSVMNKTTFLEQKKDYALYLRSFESDINTRDPNDKLIKNKDGFHFIEYQFMSILQSKIPVCAVGKPKEIDAPLGASRIYLDNANWKEDVIDLINSAKEIYILVSSRESCIWEIAQCEKYLSKTFFIIDDLAEYNKIIKNKNNLFNFPLILEKNSKEFIAMKFYNEQWEYQTYEKSSKGYSKMLNVPIPKMKSFHLYIKNPEK